MKGIGPPLAASDIDLPSSVGVRRCLEFLPRALERAETVRCVATGFLEGRSGLVVVTSKRFLFVYRSELPIAVPLSDVVRFRARAGILAAELEIEDTVGTAVIRQIHPRQRLVQLASYLNDPTAALNQDPAAALSQPGPSGRTSGPSQRDAWRPRLRTKVSPLTARAAEHRPDKPALTKVAGENPVSRSADVAEDATWHPTFPTAEVSGVTHELLPGGDSANGPLFTRVASARQRGGTDRWLQQGEWVIANFDEVMLVGEQPSGDRGSCSVTNQRIAYENEAGVRFWSFDDLGANRMSSPNCVEFLDNLRLDFRDATTARDFGSVVRAAADLIKLSSLKAR
jgi:hypothetical protein